MPCNICHRPLDQHPHGLFCCPWCQETNSEVILDRHSRLYKVDCGTCRAMGPASDSDEGAERRWNIRPSPWIPVDERLPKCEQQKDPKLAWLTTVATPWFANVYELGQTLTLPHPPPMRDCKPLSSLDAYPLIMAYYYNEMEDVWMPRR